MDFQVRNLAHQLDDGIDIHIENLTLRMINEINFYRIERKIHYIIDTYAYTILYNQEIPRLLSLQEIPLIDLDPIHSNPLVNRNQIYAQRLYQPSYNFFSDVNNNIRNKNMVYFNAYFDAKGQSQSKVNILAYMPPGEGQEEYWLKKEENILPMSSIIFLESFEDFYPSFNIWTEEIYNGFLTYNDSKWYLKNDLTKKGSSLDLDLIDGFERQLCRIFMDYLYPDFQPIVLNNNVPLIID